MVFHVQTIETENKHSFEIKLDETKQTRKSCHMQSSLVNKLMNKHRQIKSFKMALIRRMLKNLKI